MYFNYKYCYVYVPIIVVCVKVFGQINSHRSRPVRYPTKLINSPTYHQPNYNFDAYNPYVRSNQVYAETPPLRSSPYLVHDHNHNNIIDDQYYNLRDTQAYHRGKNPYYGVNYVKTKQHLPKQRTVQQYNHNTGQLIPIKPSKEQYHKKREEIHHFHTHSAIIDEGGPQSGPQSVQIKKNTDQTNPDRFYFKAHLKNNKNVAKAEQQNQSKNQLLENGSIDKYRDRSQVSLYNAYTNQRDAKKQQNVKPNYNQNNGHWNKDLYISKSDVHQNNQKLENQLIRDPNQNRMNGLYNHHKSGGYQYKKDAKLPTSINDMLNQIPRKHSHNTNTHSSPRVEYNQNIGNKNKKNRRIHSHANSDHNNQLNHNVKQKQKFSHQSISVRPLIFKQNQQEFPLEKSDATKKKKESNNVSKKRTSKQQKSTTGEHIKRPKEPYKKTVALIREFTAILPSDDDEDFASLSLIDDTPLPELTTASSAKKKTNHNKKQKQIKEQREDFYDDYEAPPKSYNDEEEVVKPVAETDDEDLSRKPKQNTQNSDHDEYQKKSEELRRLMQEDLSNKLYDEEEEEELSKPANKQNAENEPKIVKNKNYNKKANNFEKEVDISADDLERYFDKEFTSFHSDKVDNSDIKPEVDEIEVSVQPLKPEQTEEVYDEEGDDNQFKGKNFKSEFESEPSEQKQKHQKNTKGVEVSQKRDHLENESEPEYKTSSDFLRSHDDFLNRIDKENDKFRKDTEEKVNNSGKDEKDEEDNGTGNGETDAKNENEDESEDESEKKEEEEAEPTEEENKNNKENNEESEESSSNNDDSKEKTKNDEPEEDETEETKEDTSEKDNDNEEKDNDKTEEKVEKNEENEANDQKQDNNAIKQNDEIIEEYNTNEDNNGKCLDANKCNGDNADANKELNSSHFQMNINDNSNNNANAMQNMIPLSVVNTETDPSLTHNHQSYQTSLNPIPMPISMPYSDNEMLDQSKNLDDSHPELAMNPLPYYVDLQRINFNNGNILNAQKHNFVSDIDNQRVIYDNMQK